METEEQFKERYSKLSEPEQKEEFIKAYREICSKYGFTHAVQANVQAIKITPPIQQIMEG